MQALISPESWRMPKALGEGGTFAQLRFFFWVKLGSMVGLNGSPGVAELSSAVAIPTFSLPSLHHSS